MKKFATMIGLAIGITLLGLNFMSINISSNNISKGQVLGWNSSVIKEQVNQKSPEISSLNLPTIFIAIIQLAK